MNAWKATHQITFVTASGTASTRSTVMLLDGAGYTRSEWDAGARADWERDADGRWLFHGQATPGGCPGTVTVRTLP